jgi:hypothetical protein
VSRRLTRKNRKLQASVDFMVGLEQYPHFGLFVFDAKYTVRVLKIHSNRKICGSE